MLRIRLTGRQVGLLLAAGLAGIIPAHAGIPFRAELRFVTADRAANPVYYTATKTALFQSRDDGGSWNPVYIQPAGGPQPPIEYMVLDPESPQNLFAVTIPGLGGIWKSVDRGANWVQANQGLPFSRTAPADLTLAVPNAATMFVRMGARVYRSVNAGATWSQFANLPEEPDAFAINPRLPTLMFYARSHRIFRSDDEGRTWSALSVLPIPRDTTTHKATAIVLDPENPAQLYVTTAGPTQSGADAVGIHVSPNQGMSWTTPRQGSMARAQVDPADPKVVFVFPQSGAAPWRSRDKGLTWTQLTLPGGRTVSPFVAMDPRSSQRLYLASNHGMLRSYDQGERWEAAGTVNPTLIARPSQVLLQTVFGSAARIRTLVQVAAAEDETWEQQITITPPGESWVRVGPLEGGAVKTFTLDVDPVGVGGADVQAIIRLNAPNAVNPLLEVPVLVRVFATAPGPSLVLPFAGQGSTTFAGDNRPAGSSGIAEPTGLLATAEGSVLVAAAGAHSVYRVSPDGTIQRIAGTGTAGYSGDGGPAVAAALNRPTHLATDATGRLFIVDEGNRVVRVVDAAGVIRTFAGNGQMSPFQEDARATAVGIALPSGVAVGADGSVYIADEGSDRIRVVSPSGFIRTFAGADSPYFYNGDGIAAVEASIRKPRGLTVDAQGRVCFADSGNHRVRCVLPDGMMQTVAGNGRRDFGGDTGVATAAFLNEPSNVFSDRRGSLFVADRGNHRLRRIGPEGQITTVAGNGGVGFGGDCGEPTLAQWNQISAIATDESRTLYVADQYNNRVRRALVPLAGEPFGPVINLGGVTNGASFDAQLSPGGIASIFGTRLAARAAEAALTPLPATMGSAVACINGMPAPQFYASDRQLNVQLPWKTPAGPARLTVITGRNVSNVAQLNLQLTGPGVFQSDGARGVVVNQDGTLNTAANGAPRGTVVTAYLTGQGPLATAPPTGAVSPPGPNAVTSPYSVRIGEMAAETFYCGSTPGFVALAQANFRIPDLPPGTYSLVVNINGVNSKAVEITIR